MKPPVYSWKFLSQDSLEINIEQPVFYRRFDAEEWLGANWRNFREESSAYYAQLLNDGNALAKPVVLDLML